MVQVVEVGLFQRALRNQKHSRYENESKLKEPQKALKVKCEIERPIETRYTFDRKKGISWQVGGIS